MKIWVESKELINALSNNKVEYITGIKVKKGRLMIRCVNNQKSWVTVYIQNEPFMVEL